MESKDTITFYLKGGSKVEVLPLDPISGMGIRYDFIITHPDGTADSFVYTPQSSMTKEQKEVRPQGSLSLHEQEALLIFQNKYE